MKFVNSCEVWIIIKDENKMAFGYQNKHEWIKCVNIHKKQSSNKYEKKWH